MARIAVGNPPDDPSQKLLSEDDLSSWFLPNQLSDWFGIRSSQGAPKDVYLNPQGLVDTRFLATGPYTFPEDCNCYKEAFTHRLDKVTDKVDELPFIPNNGEGYKDCPYHMWRYLWRVRYAVGTETLIEPIAIAGYATKDEYDRERKKPALPCTFGRLVIITKQSGVMVLSELPYLRRMVLVDIATGLDVLESFCMAFVAGMNYRRAYPPWESIRVPRGAMKDEDVDRYLDDDGEYIDKKSRFKILAFNTRKRVSQVYDEMGRHTLKSDDEVDEYLDAVHNRLAKFE